MLQLVSSECLQWLHMWFSSFSGVSQVFRTYVASVSMQMFPLDFAKVDMVLHMLQ
jgi:hypothetical protein